MRRGCYQENTFRRFGKFGFRLYRSLGDRRTGGNRDQRNPHRDRGTENSRASSPALRSRLLPHGCSTRKDEHQYPNRMPTPSPGNHRRMSFPFLSFVTCCFLKFMLFVLVFPLAFSHFLGDAKVAYLGRRDGEDALGFGDWGCWFLRVRI